MEAQPGEQPAARKALFFSAGGVRLALRLAHVREILPAAAPGGEVLVRGEAVPAVPVAMALGLPAGAEPFALLTEGTPRTALKVDALHGIVDLARCEVFQLPSRTHLPQPPPFQGAIVDKGEVALELSPAMLGWAPMQSAPDLLPDGTPVPEDELLGPDRCLLFARGERSFAVPLGIIVQVLENVAIHPVPLTQPSHAGLLYHGKALHPVFDVGVLFGDPPRPGRTVLLVDAGGNAVGLLADRVLALGEEGPGGPVHRPSWDALFAA